MNCKKDRFSQHLSVKQLFSQISFTPLFNFRFYVCLYIVCLFFPRLLTEINLLLLLLLHASGPQSKVDLILKVDQYVTPFSLLLWFFLCVIG